MLVSATMLVSVADGSVLADSLDDEKVRKCPRCSVQTEPRVVTTQGRLAHATDRLARDFAVGVSPNDAADNLDPEGWT